MQPQTGVKPFSDRALKSRTLDARCRIVWLQNLPRAPLLTSYLSSASLQAVSSLHKPFTTWIRCSNLSWLVQDHGKVLQSPEEGLPAFPSPGKIASSPAIAGLNLNLHIGNLFEVYIIKIRVMSEGLQKEIFPLKYLVVSGTGILLKTDLCKMYTCP